MKLQHLILLGLFLSLGCKKDFTTCEPFDFERPLNQWNLFPENQSAYTYQNIDSATIRFSITSLRTEPIGKQQCEECLCYSLLETEYTADSLDLTVKNQLKYYVLNPPNLSAIFYQFNTHQAELNPDSLTLDPYEERTPSDFWVYYRDSLVLSGLPYHHVTTFVMKNSTENPIRRFYISPRQGLIGFEYKQTAWLKT